MRIVLSIIIAGLLCIPVRSFAATAGKLSDDLRYHYTFSKTEKDFICAAPLLGDINNDGINELVLYNKVMYGRTDGSVQFDFSNPDLQLNYKNKAIDDHLCIRALADVNGDGFDDIIAEDQKVFFGSAAGPRGILYLKDADVDFTLSTNKDALSYIHAIGDYNGDGYVDILAESSRYVSAEHTFNTTTAVFFGAKDLAGSYTEKMDITDERFEGAFDIGDVNGDGISDLAMSLSRYRTDKTVPRVMQRKVYLVFGAAAWPKTLKNISQRATGYIRNDVVGVEPSPYSVNAIGDVNHDGYSDMLLVFINAKKKGKYDVGKQYLLYGGSNFSTKKLSEADVIFHNYSKAFDEDYEPVNVITVGDITGDYKNDLYVFSQSIGGQGMAFLLTSEDSDGDGMSEVDGDCNDNAIIIHPGATERTDDEIDSNCNTRLYN